MTKQKQTWWQFGGSNLQAQYGYGTETNADQYCGYLNINRETDCYSATEVAPELVVSLDNGERNDGFDIDEALRQLDADEFDRDCGIKRDEYGFQLTGEECPDCRELPEFCDCD